MASLRIVITGGPASGKTDFFDRLRHDPRFDRFAFFDEVARKLLSDDPSLRSDRSRFHRLIYAAQTEQEAALSKDRPLITDRGSLDAYAFHPELLVELGTSRDAEYARYSHVIYLQTAAALGADYYRQDQVRTEPLDDVLTIDGATRRVWQDHPGFRAVAAMPDFEEKFSRFTDVMLEITNRDGG